MRPAFDIEALRAMVMGAELGSFAQAAMRLGRSQSAVSMQLKRLEEQAGRPLFQRKGRGLVPTEAGEALLSYARRIVEWHDEAARAVGAVADGPAIRIGVPQDFFEDVVPQTLSRFSKEQPETPVEVRAGRNFALAEEVSQGRLDLALAFALPSGKAEGERLARLPMRWLGCEEALAARNAKENVPLALFDHPCLFRQEALRTLDRAGRPWRLSLTTPSLAGLWAALRFGLGVTVRTVHGMPDGIVPVGETMNLPTLPSIDVRLLVRREVSPAADRFLAVLSGVLEDYGW